LAPYLQVVLVFALGLFADTYERDSIKIPELGIARFWKLPTLWWLASILVSCVISLILTSSRGAWGAAIFNSLVFTIYLRWYWILGIVTTIGTIILSAAYSPSPFKEQMRSIVPRYFWARITDEMYPRGLVCTRDPVDKLIQ
jgi:O-antigen ligase